MNGEGFGLVQFTQRFGGVAPFSRLCLARFHVLNVVFFAFARGDRVGAGSAGAQSDVKKRGARQPSLDSIPSPFTRPAMSKQPKLDEEELSRE
jgi:hypothetical protein